METFARTSEQCGFTKKYIFYLNPLCPPNQSTKADKHYSVPRTYSRNPLKYTGTSPAPPQWTPELVLE